MRTGVTLAELLTVLVIAGALAAVVIPTASRFLDGAAVQAAADRYVVLHETARQLAISRGSPARIELDTGRGTVTVSVRRRDLAWDTVESRSFGSAQLAASRSLIAFNPLGLGAGASNSSITFTRGAARRVIYVSRSGRLRRA
jgi:Tfp pilus assembly protein FimT